VDHDPLLAAQEREGAGIRDQRAHEVLDLRGRLAPVDPAVVLLELLGVARLALVLRDLELLPLADLRDDVDQQVRADCASCSSISGVVTSGGTGTRVIPSTGPASIFSTTFTMQTPVKGSPVEERPRHRLGPR
jgi:hypothetical protein